MAESNRDLQLERILLEGKHRWLRADEIYEVLQNPGVQICPTVKPPSGSIFLFDREPRKRLNDGYKWKKTKGGQKKEPHETLMVKGVPKLHCYYAHGEEDQCFQRRRYRMIEENLSQRVLVHYLRDVKGKKRKAICVEETETAEGVQHSCKIDEITPNSKMDGFASSSFQHSQPTDRTTLNSDLTLEFVNTDSEWYPVYVASSNNNPFTTGSSAITDDAMNYATALSQFNIQDSQSIIYTQEDDETTRLVAYPNVAATSAIGPTHLNPYTTANVADQAQDLQPPVLQPAATTGVVVLATTNETASSKSSNLSLVQSEPNSNANQDLAQDIIESQEKETEPTSVRPENGKGKAVVQNDFGTGKSHASAEVRDISSLKRLLELYGPVSATNPVASSSISTPTIDSQAKKKIMATLQMNFITMAGNRADMISGIHSLVDSNCFPTRTREAIMAKLKQLEQYVPLYSTAYSEYDVGKNLTLQVEAMNQHLQPKFELCDRNERELQDLEKQIMIIEARLAALRAESDGTTKEIETIRTQHRNLLQQQEQFKDKEANLKATLDEGDRLWTAFKDIVHRHFPT